MVLARTDEFRKRVLSDIADNYEEWYVKVRKMKGAFHTMNKFSTDVTSAALVGEGWVPSMDIDTLRDRLTKVTERHGSGVPAIVKIMPAAQMPPTYHLTNKYTFGFQACTNDSKGYSITRLKAGHLFH
jgi:V-type H+-transporting ATPase subunit a